MNRISGFGVEMFFFFLFKCLTKNISSLKNNIRARPGTSQKHILTKQKYAALMYCKNGLEYFFLSIFGVEKTCDLFYLRMSSKKTCLKALSEPDPDPHKKHPKIPL